MGNKIFDFFSNKRSVICYILFFLIYMFGDVFLFINQLSLDSDPPALADLALCFVFVVFRPIVGLILAILLTFVYPPKFYVDEILPKSNKILFGMFLLDTLIVILVRQPIAYFALFLSAYLPFYIMFCIRKLLIKFFNYKEHNCQIDVINIRNNFIKKFFGITFLPRVILFLLFIFIHNVKCHEIILQFFYVCFYLTLFLSIILGLFYSVKELYFKHVKQLHKRILLLCILLDLIILSTIPLMYDTYCIGLYLSFLSLHFIIFLIFYRLGRFIRKGYLYLRNNHR